MDLNLLLIAIGLITGAATLAGGALAMKFTRLIDLFVSFSSGAVIGVALFDLLPEALTLRAGRAPGAATAAMGAGFALYLVIDRLAPLTGVGGEGRRGNMGAGSLTMHSLMDGLGVGLAFQVSTAAGVVVALAVVAHDMVDGLNTVTLSLAGGLKAKAARLWLAADALAPLAGIGLSRLIKVAPSNLALLLALFSGFFLYIGASELLPRSQAAGPKPTRVAATLAGLALIFAVVRLAGG